jgi:uncharacterized protein YecT (DUF1311 family)
MTSCSINGTATAPDTGGPPRHKTISSETTEQADFPEDSSCERGSQAQMDLCVDSQLSLADIQLMSALTAEAKLLPADSVHSAQAEWTTYLNAECGLIASSYRGSSSFSWIQGACRLDLVKERLKEVQEEVAAIDVERGL